MKNYAIKLAWFTTAGLCLFVVLSALNVAFSLMFSMFIVGQALVLYTVYKVLTDNFHTQMKFKDWYRDMPKKKLDNI